MHYQLETLIIQGRTCTKKTQQYFVTAPPPPAKKRIFLHWYIRTVLGIVYIGEKATSLPGGFTSNQIYVFAFAFAQCK